MKRALLENQKVILNPEIIDREGFLSAIFTWKVSGEVPEGTTASVMLSHSDTEDGEFQPVADAEAYLWYKVDEKKPGVLAGIAVSGDEDVNVGIDLLGCRRFVKITVSFLDRDNGDAGVTHVSAMVLGDSVKVPV